MVFGSWRKWIPWNNSALQLNKILRILLLSKASVELELFSLPNRMITEVSDQVSAAQKILSSPTATGSASLSLLKSQPCQE